MDGEMRVVEIGEPGGPEALRIGKRPVPKPARGEILIEPRQYVLHVVALGHDPDQEVLEDVVPLGQRGALGLQAAVGGDEVVDGGAEDVLPAFSRLLLLLGNRFTLRGIGILFALRNRALSLPGIVLVRSPITSASATLLNLTTAASSRSTIMGTFAITCDRT